MAKNYADLIGLEPSSPIATLDIPTTDKYTPEDNLQEAAFEQAQVHELCRTNLDFLAALAMPEMVTFGYPVTYQAVWTWLLTYIHKLRDFSKLALGLPRGFAKTSLIKIFVLYCILFTNRRFILVFAATATMAENIISDVVDSLDEPNIKAVFGDWRLGLEKDTQAVKKFGFRGRNIIIAALGQGGSVRGLNMKNARPDVMIFDDIQTREDADSQTVSEQIERWMIGTAMKAKAQTGCLYIFLANMYPTKFSLLRKLKENADWIKFIAGGILADGTSLWEELVPIEQLHAEFQSDLAAGHPEIFYSEVLNDENASINNAIDLSLLPPFDFHGAVSVGSFIVIDPSNDKANSDAVSIGNFEIYDGVPTLTQLIDDKLSPGNTIKKALEMALENRTGLILVEANAYQYSLCYWFEVIMEQLDISGIEVVPIYSGSLAKNSRILTMFKQYVAGEIAVHPRCVSQVHMQITQFNPLKTNNVDGILDLLAYAPRVLTEFAQYIAIKNPLGNEDFDSAKVLDVEETCSF